jgi:hypothetical protein
MCLLNNLTLGSTEWQARREHEPRSCKRKRHGRGRWKGSSLGRLRQNNGKGKLWEVYYTRYTMKRVQMYKASLDIESANAKI